MRTRLLGKSGLRVSEICLGTLTFGDEWGFGASRDEAREMFHAYLERGGSFIDTANFYTGGTSERLVGELIAGDRGRFVLATKYTMSTRPDDVNASGNHRKNMVQSVEDSLKRLGTDYIDLYWVHAWDFLSPVDEVMRGLDDLVQAGKVLYLGVSDVPAWIVSRANTMAELRGWTSFIGLQVEYSLIERTAERELFPMARALGLGVTVWGALGGGVLVGKHGAAKDDSRRVAMNEQWQRYADKKLAIAAEVAAVAREIGRTPAQVATRWIQRQDVAFPILGARTLEQLKDNLGSIDFELAPEHAARLDQVSAIELGFPHDLLASEILQKNVYGDKRADIAADRR